MSNKQKSIEGVESATTSIPRLQLAHFVLGTRWVLPGTDWDRLGLIAAVEWQKITAYGTLSKSDLLAYAA